MTVSPRRCHAVALSLVSISVLLTQYASLLRILELAACLDGDRADHAREVRRRTVSRIVSVLEDLAATSPSDRNEAREKVKVFETEEARRFLGSERRHAALLAAHAQCAVMETR